jgi:hypothetical protein
MLMMMDFQILKYFVDLIGEEKIGMSSFICNVITAPFYFYFLFLLYFIFIFTCIFHFLFLNGCSDESDDQIYPGRLTPKLDEEFANTNCNGLFGYDPVSGQTWNDELCKEYPTTGIAAVGGAGKKKNTLCISCWFIRNYPCFFFFLFK